MSAQVPAPPPGHRFADRVALVTGAARGIGAATAARLAQGGARVVCLDVPQAPDALCTLARRLGGEALTLDIAAPDAAEA
ncbi:SDR family oxidoreductase, partial [Staphylococcus aureus]